MTLKEIQELIKMLKKSNVGEIKIEEKEFKISIRSKDYIMGTNGSKPMANPVPVQTIVQQPAMPAAQPVAPAQAPPAAAQPPANSDSGAAEEANYITVKAPMIGTFYRSSSPDKPPFIQVGDTIKEGDVLCIIEAMKLFNEIESEVSGKVVKILADDASPIEYDQPLLLVDPS